MINILQVLFVRSMEMREKLFVLILAAAFCVTEVTGQILQSQFRNIQSGNTAFLARKKNGENEYSKFFAIGTNLQLWPNSRSASPRFPSEDEFTSSREIFTVLFNTYPDVWPEYFQSDPKEYDCLFLSGMGYLNYYMRRDTNYNTFPKPSDDGWFIGPEDQAKAAERERKFGSMSARVDKLIDLTRNRGDFVLFLADEPDAGMNGSWTFYGNFLEILHKRNKSKGHFTYIDLAPITGNMLIYEQKSKADRAKYPMPPNNEPKYNDRTFQYSSINEETNVKTAYREYLSACDIIGLNSYGATSANPAKIGEIVDWLREVDSTKPIWPWITAEKKRYRTASDEEFRQGMRRQAFTAISRGSSGVMIYSEGRKLINDLEWDISLDLAKELNMYRSIFEQGGKLAAIGKGGSRARLIDWGGRRFIVASNNQDSIWSIRSGFFKGLKLNRNEFGIWTSDNGKKIKKISAPRNLGFEDILVKEWAERDRRFLNWKVSADGGGEANISQKEQKLGSNSLHLSCVAGSRSTAEQFIQTFPGAIYEVKAWYKHFEGIKPQRLILLFYDKNAKWISEVSVKAHFEKKWKIVKLEDIAAPPNAEIMKIHFDTGVPGEEISSGFWDDVVIRMTGIK